MKLNVLILILIVTAVPALRASDQAIYFERIEFRGVRNIDKYELIRSSKAMISGKGILVYMDSLKRVLDSSVIIKSYNLGIEGSQLVITVQEKYPLFMLLKVEKNISVPCLSDENGNIIDSGRFFSTDMPIIIGQKDFFDSGENGNIIRGLFENLVRIHNESKDFAAELEEIEIVSAEELRVKLRSRKTEFMVKNDMNGLKKIEKTAAYLDAAGTYPGTVDLRYKRTLIRQ